jgi:2-methylcitrate dehydratase
MDKTTAAIAKFVEELTFAELTSNTTAAAKVRIFDTIICAWGGVDAKPAVIARKALLGDGQSGPATLIGGGVGPTETVAFVNSLMSRYLDFNDWAYPAGHPSDLILPLLAVGEEVKADGKEFLTIIVAAYQVYLAISKGGALTKNRWDVGIALSVATAAGAARLHGLDAAGIGNAVGIAAACGPALSVRVTGSRASMWKAGSGPQSCKTGVFAAQLAAFGMTGPDAPFEGRNGVFERVCDPFEIAPLLDLNLGTCVEQSVLKLFPTEIHAQAPIAAALELRRQIPDASQIMSVEIRSYERMIVTVGGPDRWNPETRESADHSAPYAVSVALLDGVVNSHSFDEANLTREDVRDLMAKITIEAVDEFEAAYPGKLTSAFRVTLADGKVVEHRIDYPLGHPSNPASDEALEQKLHALVRDGLSSDQVARLRRSVDELESLGKLSVLLAP